jgi:hypothetical protein
LLLLEACMGLIARFRTVLRVLRRRKRPIETLRLLRRRPALLVAVSTFETALLASARAPARPRALATIKTSALIGCPF